MRARPGAFSGRALFETMRSAKDFSTLRAEDSRWALQRDVILELGFVGDVRRGIDS
jgi:hypothetical protein